MEEMNNVNVENIATEMVEEVSDKLTFGENLTAYVLAGVFVTGVAAIGYLGYKGVKGISKKIKNKKKYEEVDDAEQAVNDVEECDIHEVKDNETEQD